MSARLARAVTRAIAPQDTPPEIITIVRTTDVINRTKPDDRKGLFALVKAGLCGLVIKGGGEPIDPVIAEELFELSKSVELALHDFPQPQKNRQPGQAAAAYQPSR